MKMHAMLDLETLGTGPSAHVLQIGAVAFSPRLGDKFDVDIARGSAFNALIHPSQGRAIDPATVGFWLGQAPSRPATKFALALGGGAKELEVLEPLSDALMRLKAWWLRYEIEAVWAFPSIFDVGIMNHAFAQHGVLPPWDRRKIYDCRTAIMLTATNGVPPTVAHQGDAHDAVDDCLYQIVQLRESFAQGLLHL